MVLEEAQNDPNVLIGTLSINSVPVTILFDPNATYSIIYVEFIRRCALGLVPPKDILVVSSPSGEKKTRGVCANVTINLKGMVFTATLIVLEFKRLDVILGMDWLIEFDREIHCTIETMYRAHLDGTKDDYSSLPASTEMVKLNHGEATNKVGAISEVSDVISQELSGDPF